MKKSLCLPDVTLLTVTSVDLDNAVFALNFSSEKIDFGAIKLLAPARPATLDSSIEHVPIAAIDFRGYSKFVLESLHAHVDTPFCLIVQADGFVVNPHLWNDAFFEYDYIGAPWPERLRLKSERWLHMDKNRVGNGGFSLRSRRLLELTSHIEFDQLTVPVRSEDLVICHFLYDRMIQAGVKFAPLDVAKRFSVESWVEEPGCDIDHTFGFHGRRWLAGDRLPQITKRVFV